MAFSAGKDAAIYINGFDLTSFFSESSSEEGSNNLETTVFGKTFRTRIGSLKDGSISASGFFDGTTDAVDEELQGILGSADKIWTHLIAGDANGSSGRSMQAFEQSYTVDAPVDGVVSVSAEAFADDGLDRVIVLHAKGAETATGVGTSHDNGAATTNGGVAYIHNFAASGTSPTLSAEIQDSDDDVSFVSGASFAQITAANAAERITWTGTTRRYVRVTWTITGTGPSFTFHVSYGRSR